MRRLCLLALLGCCAPALAVIIRLTALSEVVEESTFIVVAKVASLDEKRPALMLEVSKTLKGKTELTKLPVLLSGDAGAKKRKEVPQLLERVAVKLPVVLFVSQRDKEYTAFGYTEGTWFNLAGQTVEGEVRWSFAHLEPYLRRTFKGTTDDLIGLLDGKKALPKPDAKEKPGLGPPLKKADETPRPGVIPMVLIGGPLALLALLFPGLFAGWDRWLALLSTAGTASTVLLLVWLFGVPLAGTWLGSPVGVWALIVAVHLVGLFWALRRHAARVKTGDAPLVPGRFEVALLAAMAALSVAGLAALTYAKYGLKVQVTLGEWWPVVAYAAALIGAAAYAAGLRLRGPRLRPASSSEAVCLFGVAVACLPVGPALVPAGRAAAVGTPPALRWTFRLPAAGDIVSSPLVHGDRVYVAAAHASAFNPYGRLYCLDRETGAVVWTFDDGRKMKSAFSSPVIAGGRLYIGEGLHQDERCRLFVLDPASGAKVAEFATLSHTEATPVVAGSRVYQGAGDDGLYCLEADGVTKAWNFGGFHIDTGPAVADGGVFVGCGVGDAFKETAIFRLDAATGKPAWRVATDLPVWTEVLVSGGRVYAGMGNGRLNEEPENPRGLVVCLDAKTGDQEWRVKLADGVLGRLALDARRLYFGCRDGGFYCLRRADGCVVWRHDLGGAVVAGPALDRPDGTEDAPTRLYVVANGGRFECLEAATGRPVWGMNLVEGETQAEAIATPARDGRRLYVGLTVIGTSRLGELRCYEE